MRKVIITAALTGAGHGKEANPNLPEQPEEIIEQALQCRDAGAAIVHLHARDKSGNNTMSLDIFRKIHEGIKTSSDLIVELSTGGGPTLPNEERIAPMLLKPEMASLNTFMMIMPVKGVETPFIYKRSEIEESARRARELGVKPAIAILKPYVLDIGLNLPAQGTLRGTWRNLVALVERIPEGAVFNVAAGGEAELPLTTMGMLLGGNPRVGLEDNVYYVPGRLAKSNAELVARTARITRELNLEIATPDEAREILQLRR